MLSDMEATQVFDSEIRVPPIPSLSAIERVLAEVDLFQSSNDLRRAIGMLQQAGFVDIKETVIRAPLNPWPADPHQKDIGRWYNLGMTEGLEALSLGPLTRVSRWPVDSVKQIVRDVKRVMCNKKIHAYNNM